MTEDCCDQLVMNLIRMAADEVGLSVESYMLEASIVAVVDRFKPKLGNENAKVLGLAVLRQAAADCKSKQYRIRMEAARWINTENAQWWCELCGVKHLDFAYEASLRVAAAEKLASTM